MGLLGQQSIEIRDIQPTAKPQASSKNKGEKCDFMKTKKKEIGRGYFEPKSVGKKQEFRVMMVSHLAELLR